MLLTITHPIRPARPSLSTSLVADHFGLTERAGPHVVAERLELPIEPGMLVAFTGPSGSGKSSLLRAAIAELERSGDKPGTDSHVIRLDELVPPDVPVIDALGIDFEQAMPLLSGCGLTEPRLMLRRPAELSDGERWRFRLAFALAQRPQWIAADEFTAALDRTLAKVIAFNLRRQCDRTRVGLLVATCHDDVIEDLRPDLHVRCDHDGLIEVGTQQNILFERKTPCSASRNSWKSRPERQATGRISLGGIIGRTTSAECGSSRCSGMERGRSASASSQRLPSRSPRETATSNGADAGRD